jgi:EpsI family protein
MARIASFRIAFLFVAISLASFASWALTPRANAAQHAATLASVVPSAFGEWHAIALAENAVDPRNQGPGETDREAPYDDVLMRGYQNGNGDVVVLALAYGRHQRQEVKIHRPELCYTAQGFQVLTHSPVNVPLGGGQAQGARMLVRGNDRVEAVSYWIRIGDLYSRSAWKTRTHIFSEGMHGRIVDGILVRVSQSLPDAASATPERFALQERFLAELVSALPGESRGLLVAAT